MQAIRCATCGLVIKGKAYKVLECTEIELKLLKEVHEMVYPEHYVVFTEEW